MALQHEDNKSALSIALKKSKNGAYFSMISMRDFIFFLTSPLQLDIIHPKLLILHLLKFLEIYLTDVG